jgi:hypothetical protein
VAVITESRLADAAAAAFRRWQDALAAGLVSAGATPERAAGVATMVVASVEGATLLCRARRSLEPFDDVVAELEVLIASACEKR